MVNSEFRLIDKNCIISEMAKSDIFDNIMGKLLSSIDSHLGILVNNNIKISLDKFNFDNLQIVQSTQESVMCLYKFDLKTHMIMISYDSIIYNNFSQTDFHPLFKHILSSMTSKLNILTNKGEFSTKNAINLGPKIVNPNLPKPMNSVIIEKPMDLEKELESLKELKSQAISKLESLKENIKEETDKFSELHNDHEIKKRDLRKKLEKDERDKNRFNANKTAYYKMKRHIEKGQVNESAIINNELFAKEYPLFKFMDINNLLGQVDEYTTYSNLYNEMYSEPNENEYSDEESYVPHNINYLKKRNIPPLDKILDALSEDSDDDLDTTNVNFDNVSVGV